MRRYPHAGCAVDTVLLPKKGASFEKWAVVACDQYSSKPQYWQDVDTLVGDAPSTLRMIYPEAFLNEADPDARIRGINAHMKQYTAEELLEGHDGMIYVERQVGSEIRKGIVLCLDLEQYDYSKGSTTLVRATEGTIVERIPPRVRIRDAATLELPHIMVLIDDPTDTVIAPITAAKAGLPKVYDFDLMKASGHITGWCVTDRRLEEKTMDALGNLAKPEVFLPKYGLKDTPPMVYAMGDGNHSLATAKAIWERTKAQATDKAAVLDDPARFALVEIVNVYDGSLVFEPIHRVLFHLNRDVMAEMKAHFGGNLVLSPVATLPEMEKQVREAPAGVQRFGVIRDTGFEVAEVKDPPTALAVGTLQSFLDPFVKSGGAKEIDYVHDTDEVHRLGCPAGNIGFYLPAMAKSDLFRSVILDGALPRKTFSMGESKDKRFYLECRALG